MILYGLCGHNYHSYLFLDFDIYLQTPIFYYLVLTEFFSLIFKENFLAKTDHNLNVIRFTNSCQMK